MKQFLIKWTNVFLATALFSAFSATSIDLVFAAPSACIEGFTLKGSNCEQRFDYSAGARAFKVPAGLGGMEIELYGAAGGNGGLDCGTGCSIAQSGQVGRLGLVFDDLAGKNLVIYPGGAGQLGQSGVSASGGGAGGRSTYNSAFDGGRGGDAGPVGTSGAGGGGGAATVLVISNKLYVAAGAGGGGGSANSRNGSTWGNTEPNYVAQGSRGGNGLSSSPAFFADGGGGGGGGAGVQGGAGGDLYRAPNGDNEAAGNGGSAGTNTAVGAEVKSSSYVELFDAGSIIIRYVSKLPPSSLELLSPAKTNLGSSSYQLTLPSSRKFTVEDIEIGGTVTEAASFEAKITSKKFVGTNTAYIFKVSQSDDSQVVGELKVSVFGVDAQVVNIDELPIEGTFTLQPDTLLTAEHTFDVRLNKPVSTLTVADFKPASGTATGCSISDVIGSGENYTVVLSGCSDGTFGVTLAAGAAIDEFGNSNSTDLSSTLLDKTSPVTTAQISSGTIPKEFLKKSLTSVFGDISAETENALAALGIYAPMPDAPTVSMFTDMTQVVQGQQLTVESTQTIDAGASVKLGVGLAPTLADTSDVVAFLKTNDVWQFLGRTSFSNGQAISDAMGMSAVGNFQLRLVVIPKTVDTTTMSVKTGFGQSLSPKQSVTDPQTALGDQVVNITLVVQAPADGVPTPVDNLLGTGTFNALGLDISLPEIPFGQPVANPAIGATGDDNAPSQPFDPLGTPESIKAVTKTTVTAVAVVSTVAAAAGAAASAAAGAASGAGSTPRASASSGSSATGSSASSNTSSGASTQDTDTSDGSISTFDATVESFTSTHLGLGDRIPIFRLGIFTFLDKFSHNLTLSVSKVSPILGKIINDGAYLRAIFGSFWLAFPSFGVWLALQGLAQPSTELVPPVWTIFLAIAILGIFDALSGMLATLVYVIGASLNHGITSVSDVRMFLGVLVLGFGPALIAVAFRAIRKHFETNFSYFWERLVDIAVLTFFTFWTVSSMVSTLPALAGKTLQAANHVHDFAFYLSAAIIIRILFEEIAARVYPARLDQINPTEIPETAFAQKLLSTMLRLGVFIFVTAAFMGNTWQVWVGSVIFILPNVLSWVEDKLPNYPWIWHLIPTGVPGLALSLVVASFSSMGITAWLGDNPEYSQYAFMLLPIPMFVLGLIGMFGRSGKNESDERFIKRTRLRWIYRLGGIVVLVITVKLAGVI